MQLRRNKDSSSGRHRLDSAMETESSNRKSSITCGSCTLIVTSDLI
ncbi:hypothetical protein EYF80_061302 [Liparis tanakae]|uniref:Uncharacterized protein n=1 Tax=Liparis tanakae TaxID=230148 RepID=A0A4Z2EJ02_9TELE|nr:hypothetical protein EYF80_061302 [Liparis tanakae]